MEEKSKNPRNTLLISRSKKFFINVILLINNKKINEKFFQKD